MRRAASADTSQQQVKPRPINKIVLAQKIDRHERQKRAEKEPGSIYDRREVMLCRARINLFGLPLHIVLRGHDRNACFFCEN